MPTAPSTPHPPRVASRHRTALHAAWTAYGDHRQITSVTEVSAFVSTNAVYRISLDDGSTVIAKDLSIDSLAIMDMVMELEDRFDVAIPMGVIAEIHTVDQLADTIRDLRNKA